MEDSRSTRNGAGKVGLITTPARSKRSDRVQFLPRVDGRTLMARRWQELASNLIGDAGGADHVSTAKMILLKRLAATAAMLEEIEARYISSAPVDVQEYIALSQLAARLANSVGLSRKARQVPDLNEYLASRNYANGHTNDEGDVPPRHRRVIRGRIIEHDDPSDEDESDD